MLCMYWMAPRYVNTTPKEQALGSQCMCSFASGNCCTKEVTCQCFKRTTSSQRAIIVVNMARCVRALPLISGCCSTHAPRSALHTPRLSLAHADSRFLSVVAHGWFVRTWGGKQSQRRGGRDTGAWLRGSAVLLHACQGQGTLLCPALAAPCQPLSLPNPCSCRPPC